MLARQERQDESYQEVPVHQAEEHKPERQEMFVHRVLNTSLRSHFQVLFIVTALLAMLVTIGSGISASRGYTLVETQSEATRIEQENERLNVEIAKLKNPERIKAIAESQLGMQVPKKTYFSHESK
ncbi:MULTISPECIES: cell division protein FtsL [Mitsuokella]|uniref:cell division protein FtsL n=1 Tax=Mitsuokella TaxID=52225 RepID=UPI001D034044|nr:MULTISPECIES: cell division protein FtsL [Mitsuokella]MCB5725526.1 cell division protein FtsL [Mitsuokella jalaludinii]MCI6607854.1 cell division protein FtsL [Mitsuokella jalaludinii]MCI6611997.1 cell division protein FtsL [Mitsuokella jalaludinii]MCI7186430.1 cell division protein FtsL [Mitsuokella jalaludinii]MCI7716866.1 cell division protein FtsL [Mitsuokella jalaludinii]